MLERTPGVAPVGAIVTLGVLVAGAMSPNYERAWDWAFLPAGFTLLVVYATVIATLGRHGNLAALALAGLLVILIAWGLFPDVVQDAQLPVLHAVALGLTGLCVAAVERARAASSAAGDPAS